VVGQAPLPHRRAGRLRRRRLAGRLDTGAALAKRKPLKVEFDTLEDAMGRLQLSLTLPLGADGAPVEIELGDLDAFHPDTIYGNVSLFSQLAALRKRLNTTGTFAAAAAEVQAWAEVRAPRPRRWPATPPRAAPRPRAATLDDFARLTGRPSTAAEAEGAIDDLLQRVVGPFVVPSASPKKDALVAAVDEGLSDAMRAVLHHPTSRTPSRCGAGSTSCCAGWKPATLQVHLFDISAEEFAADLSSVRTCPTAACTSCSSSSPRRTPTAATACWRLLLLRSHAPHAELLGRAARVAAHAGAPLLTAMATDPFADRKEPPHRLVREAFAALREMSDASFLALFGPRFLLRHPYGKQERPDLQLRLRGVQPRGRAARHAVGPPGAARAADAGAEGACR
jgi:type VI secretion system protein ImpC